VVASGWARLTGRVRVPAGRRTARTVTPSPPGSRRDPEAELWSTFGYETVCLLWGLPVEAVERLSQAERQAIARVSMYLDGLPAAEKDPLVRAIADEAPSKRLARFRRLAREGTGTKGTVAR
jgi:hypothetical protein